MTTNNSVDMGIQKNADGGQIALGTVKRFLKWLGADITMTGSGTSTYTFPGTSGTLVDTTHNHVSGAGAQIPTNGIADDAVTYAKMQNVSATDKLLGRATAGAGNVEEIACTAAARSLLDDASIAAMLTTLGIISGWILIADTWTRTGNHTFTIAGDVTTTYRKGTRVRYKQGGAYEYGVVISSSYGAPNTTVTLATNDDYAMAAGALTDTYISYVENPEGYPEWFNYTPTYSGSASMTFTSVTTTVARFRVTGTLVFVHIYATGTTGGTASNNLQATEPIPGDAVLHIFATQYRDATSGGTAVGSGWRQQTTGFICRRADIGVYGLGAGRIMLVTGFYGMA